MGRKKKNLDRLVELGFNVHEYKEISNLNELIDYSNYNKKFSIRFDSTDERHGLPFYTYNESEIDDKILYFDTIINEMKTLNCSLLCSNGYNYDTNLIFNFVIDVDRNNDFILELCSKKVPLREMYLYKTTIIKGNIFDDYKKYNITNKNDNSFDENDINRIINIILDNNISVKYLEGTIYSSNVGIMNDKIVFWQTNNI